MKQPLRAGLQGEEIVLVGSQNQIRFADDLMPPVLATPSLIDALEAAARHAIQSFLEPHERSVGTYLQVEHLAPTPVGMRVSCRARLILVQGDLLTYKLEAEDELEVIARGIHRRRVIDARRFASRLDRKRSSQSEQS